MENEESLESGAIVTHLADLIHDSVNDILSNGVVTAGIVIGSIFLSGNDTLRVVKSAVVTSTDRITYSWLEIDQYRTGDMFASLGFREEGVKSSVFYAYAGVARHGSILFDSMLEAVKFPTRVSYCKTCLTDVK
jgi:hypothetical protein